MMNAKGLKQLIQVNNKNKMRDGNDSDNDQGFVPTKVQIKSDNKTHKHSKNDNNQDSNNRPIDFQARYIFGDGILRKEPVQVYTRFRGYLPDPVSQDLHKQANKIPISVHPPNSQQSHYPPQPIPNNNPNKPSTNPQPHQSQNQKTAGQPPAHPYEKYIASDSYTLVYSRIKERMCAITPESDDFGGNQVSLAKVLGKYDADHYSVLKGFQAVPAAGHNKKETTSKGNKEKQLLTSSTKSHAENPNNLTTTTQQHSHSHSQNVASFRIRAHSNAENLHPKQQNMILQAGTGHQDMAVAMATTIHSFQHGHMVHGSQISSALQQPPIQQLQFDSKFQSGNLLYAFKSKTNPTQYTLFLHNDTNSYGYNQWFYFSVRGMRPHTTYKFSIVNFRKKHSLFREGMKIAVFSLVEALTEGNQGNGWRKMGDNIRYQRSGIKKFSDKKYKFYSLSFELQFPHEGDHIKIAMNIPYSYSRLIHHLKICGDVVTQQNKSNQEHDKKMREEVSRRPGKWGRMAEKREIRGQVYWGMGVVGYSIANNAVPYLTVTNASNIEHQHISQNKPQPSAQQQQTQHKQHKQPQQEKPQPQQSPLPKPPKKKTIILLARQHPGQTWSSFMMQQILYLLSENKNPYIRYLLENYVFKIFPMVNVDGVIYGNFRCDLGGFDLNRNWRKPDRSLHPQVWAIKGELEKIAGESEIACVLDLHGHSKQYNTFSYSCKNDPISSRVLSLLISQLNPLFHFPSCTFGLSKYKETTARAILYKLSSNENILTIQNSFYGAKLGNRLVVYDPETMGQLSRAILEGVGIYLEGGDRRGECQRKVKENLEEFLGYERQGDGDVVDSGSESEPYADEISIKEKIKKILPKSFKAIQSQLEQQEKMTHKKTSSPVKRRQQKKPSSKNQNYKTLNPPKSKISKKQTQQQQTISQTFIQRTSLTHYKRNSKQLNRKKEPEPEAPESGESSRQARISINNDNDNRVVKTKVGDVGLPFYIRQKSTLVPIKLKNDSLQIFKDAYNATKGQFQSNLHKTMTRPSNKKVKILNQTQGGKQQFPLLCVLSQQKKRQSQLQKTHHHIFLQQQQQSHQTQRGDRQQISTSLPPKIKPFVQNEKLEHMRKINKNKHYSFKNNNNEIGLGNTGAEVISEKLKEKNHKDATLISKIWRENFARYGKDLNVFFGGMKG